ncbi:hypothetical protein P0F00_003065 [Vibrio metschnikovii]|nr:hypothetical protein [Vibrio metschnikovii]
MFLNKNVFIITPCDRFFYLYIDSLIVKSGLDLDEIVVIVIGVNNESLDGMIKYPNIKYVGEKSITIQTLGECNTITSISLSAKNSPFMEEIFLHFEGVSSKYFLLITDDEFERWSHCYNEFHCLKISKKYQICSSDLFVLEKTENMIGFKNIFHEKITDILGKDINFIDCGLIFDTMPVSIMNKIEGVTYFDSITESDKKLAMRDIPRVLFRTKTYGLDGFIDWARLLLSSRREVEIHFVTFMSNPIFIIFSEIIRLYSKLFFKAKFKIDYNMHSSPYSYTMNLLGCSHLIVQSRGGGSTARTFIKFNGGIVLAEHDSHNHKFLSEGYAFDILTYQSISQVTDLIKNGEIRLSYNQCISQQKENESLSLLSNVYSINKQSKE